MGHHVRRGGRVRQGLARWAAHHRDGDAEFARGEEFGICRTAAGVFGDDPLDLVRLEQRQVFGEREGWARFDEREVGVAAVIGPEDGADDERQIRPAQEGRNALRSDGEENARTEGQKALGVVEGIDLAPVVGWSGGPGRAFEPQVGDAGCDAGGVGVGAHHLSERVGGVDQHVDALAAQVSREPFGAAEAADADVSGVVWARGAARERGDGVCVGRDETLCQVAGFGGAPQEKNARHRQRLMVRQDGANAVDDHDVDFCGLARHGLGLRPRGICDERGKRDWGRGLEGSEASGRVRDALGGRGVAGGIAQAGEETEVHLAAGRMQVHRAGGELGEFCKTACDGHALDRVAGEVFEEAAGKVAHVDHGVVREAERRLRGSFGRGACGGGDVGQTSGAGDIDAAVDGMDPRGAGVGIDDACGAQNGEAADNAEPRVPGFGREFGAAWDADAHDDVRDAARDFAQRRFDHGAGDGVDRGFADGERKAIAGDRADALACLERNARASVANLYLHAGAVGHVGIIASIFDDGGFSPSFAAPLARQDECSRSAAWQRYAHRVGEFAGGERRVGRLCRGGGAGPSGPAFAERARAFLVGGTARHLRRLAR